MDAQFDFDSGLQQTVRWYLENGAWCDAVRAGRYAGERLGFAAPDVAAAPVAALDGADAPRG